MPHNTVRRSTKRISGTQANVSAATVITLSVPPTGYIVRFHVTSGSNTTPVLSEEPLAAAAISQVLAISVAGVHHDEVPAEGIYYQADNTGSIYLKPVVAAGTTTVNWAVDVWMGG